MNTNQSTTQSLPANNLVASSGKHSKPVLNIPKILVASLITITIFSGTAIATLGLFQTAYAQKVMPNVYLANESVSSFTPEQLNNKIQELAKEFASQKVTIVLNKDQKIQTTNQELGREIDYQSTKNQILQIGRNLNYYQLAITLLDNSLRPQNIYPKIRFSKTKYNQFLETNITPLGKNPVDANLEFKDNALNIIDGQNGFAVNNQNLYQQIAADNSLDFLVVNVESKEITPDVTRDNLENIKAQLDQLIANPPTLVAGTRSLKMKGEDLFKVLSFQKVNNRLVVNINDQALAEYLQKNEWRLVIKKVDKQIAQDSGIVLREGKNGQKINSENAKITLAQNLNNYLTSKSELPKNIELAVEEEAFAEVKIDPASLLSLSALDAAVPTGKSIVVDISEQRLTAFENGQVSNSFLISSGIPGYETPRGTFAIRSKVYSKWYRGTNPNGSVWSYPNTLYNMNFTGPYYLHGAYWHNNFGRKMSHGCVNIAYPNAEWLWNWSSIGIPVIVQN